MNNIAFYYYHTLLENSTRRANRDCFRKGNTGAMCNERTYLATAGCPKLLKEILCAVDHRFHFAEEWRSIWESLGYQTPDELGILGPLQRFRQIILLARGVSLFRHSSSAGLFHPAYDASSIRTIAELPRVSCTLKRSVLKLLIDWRYGKLNGHKHFERISSWLRLNTYRNGAGTSATFRLRETRASYCVINIFVSAQPWRRFKTLASTDSLNSSFNKRHCDEEWKYAMPKVQDMKLGLAWIFIDNKRPLTAKFNTHHIFSLL